MARLKSPAEIAWERRAAPYRKVILAGNPPCALCGHPGADTVDHILAKSQRPDLVFDLSNMRPAHRSCNSRKYNRSSVGLPAEVRR